MEKAHPSPTHLCTHQVHACTCRHKRKLERGHLPKAAVQVGESFVLQFSLSLNTCFLPVPLTAGFHLHLQLYPESPGLMRKTMRSSCLWDFGDQGQAEVASESPGPKLESGTGQGLDSGSKIKGGCKSQAQQGTSPRPGAVTSGSAAAGPVALNVPVL